MVRGKEQRGEAGSGLRIAKKKSNESKLTINLGVMWKTHITTSSPRSHVIAPTDIWAKT